MRPIFGVMRPLLVELHLSRNTCMLLSHMAGRPGGVSGYPRAGIGQFREFEPRRVHPRITSLGLFLVHKLTCGKRES